MDELARYNRERWEELAKANVEFSRPALDLNEGSARLMVDPEGVMGVGTGKNVLCLAGGGGQQSAAFALLRAYVTVVNFSETQLRRDREAAEHYGVRVATVLGDMRDLSCFADDSFDVVWHAHSLNFVPDACVVFDEVRRVVRAGGLYRLHYTNPFVHGVWEKDWDGRGYSLCRPYVDGAEVVFDDPHWDFDDGTGRRRRVKGPKEFRHTLSAVVNGLVTRGFVMLGVWEDTDGDVDAKPATWTHLQAIAPAFLSLWAAYRPELAHAPR